MLMKNTYLLMLCATLFLCAQCVATAAPITTSFTPTSGTAGATVTITGAGFTGAKAVKFNGVAASIFTVVSATSIKAVVPKTTTGKITVTTLGGMGTSAASFTFIPAPTVTSFTPASGGMGATVTITGTSFKGTGFTTTAVKFNGVAASSFTVVSATSVKAVMPKTTTGKITVTTPGGTATSLASLFAPPTITLFTPTSGGVGATVIIGGTSFTGATAVKFNSIAATSFTVVSATSIKAVVPKTTTGRITVTTPGGTATSAVSFAFIPAPTITSFTPTSGAAGASVTITGTNFTSASAVRFNGVAATSFTVVSPTSIKAVVPRTITGKIAVGTLGGTAVSVASFTPIPVLSITQTPVFWQCGVVTGTTSGIIPSDYYVAMLIFVPGSGWWTKPSCALPYTTISSSGAWSASMCSGGIDNTATIVDAYLIRKTSYPAYYFECVLGDGCVPASFVAAAAASQRVYRSGQRRLRWSGYDWTIKSSAAPVGPGSNYFSDSTNNVWVDSNSRLHLRITNNSGRWNCAEMVSDTRLGYGTYRFYCDSRIDTLDPNVTAGLFTWSDFTCTSAHREIDIEFSKWGNPYNANNAQFVRQPFDTPGNIHPFAMTSAATSTHSFTWTTSGISFSSVVGHCSAPTPCTPVSTWTFSRAQDIPPSLDERLYLNLWLNNDGAPYYGHEVELVISSFKFLPMQ